MPTDEQLSTATLAAARQIRAKLNCIGIHTPNWFAEEAANVITTEIRKVLLAPIFWPLPESIPCTPGKNPENPYKCKYHPRWPWKNNLCPAHEAATKGPFTIVTPSLKTA